MNVLLVIPTLSRPGGAERVVSIMANYWARQKGWDVTVATFDAGEEPPFYTLSSEVKHEALGIAQHSSKLVNRVANTGRRIKTFEQYSILKQSLNLVWSLLNIRRRLKVLRQYFEAKRPDAIISFMTETNILALLSGSRTKIPVIVLERNNPAYQLLDVVTSRLRKRLYPRASGVVCQTQGILEFFLPGIAKNGMVIPNPVMPLDNTMPSVPEISLPDGNLLFAIGNMSKRKIYQKGFDLLVSVFSNLAKRHEDWNLVILGDGSQRDALQQQVEECGLSHRVFMPGTVKNVPSLLYKGDLFVLPSRYEGFPNVLCEAMACGLPAVSFDCPTGPRDIVRHGVDGLLIPPEDALALERGLDTLMSDKEMREDMGAKAREVVDRFSLETIMQMWEKLILRCVHGR